MDGIPGSTLTGPFPVGQYAAALKDRLRGFTRVQVFGEVFGFKAGRAKVWFELRDASGALPCSMWREDFDKLKVGPLADGAQVVVAGGCDYYPGSRTASPSFSFSVTRLRVAGEGDLLAQLDQLRKRLHAEGLFEPQKALPRPRLPKVIGVVTGESGKARDDVLAGLRRRGWAGRVVWGFAPVQDRHAAPAITRKLQDLAACEEVEVIVVARGGGSLADLFAFCDETLCRTVALLRVPVISSVGHHTDRTLLDDVAAVACSTPTHAAETAVPVDCTAARAALAGSAARLHRQSRRAVLDRARTLARLSRAPGHHVARHRTRLHQQLRELRAATRRAITTGERGTQQRAAALTRKATAASFGAERAARRAQTDAATLDRASAAALERRRRDLDRILGTLAAHDPQRTLERGYALLEDEHGEPITTAAAAEAQQRLTIRLHDGRVHARPERATAAPDEPATATDEPMATDEPVATTDEPVAATDEPVAATDEPVATTDEPATAPDEPAAPGEPAALPDGLAPPDEAAPAPRRLKPATAAGRAAHEEEARLF
ncbi:exodeoxyribonuclease VII large subunit [Solirubrobacter pauli]|uniref:Exodeoxyribonuclease 7 large subunit n=1 Tax=Solirubrobacter pauli TaxID=166793 RepID=A0A660LK60_9ACTN|nr:exodeoxyribonuclease VII large subunit [Solirubrobacter pauli]RKQ93854.1 exodeoxyribonuclease VII large subunit [Solirubrobacter pauli]